MGNSTEDSVTQGVTLSSNISTTTDSNVSMSTTAEALKFVTTISSILTSTNGSLTTTDNSSSSNLNDTTFNTTFLNATTNSTMDEARAPTPQEMKEFYIGLTLAVLSSLFIGSSFIFKKLGLLRLAKNSATRAGQGGYGYLKEWMWWAGMILMTVGEFANFAAYAFAPATLVTPLGALSVLVSAILASRVLKERLNLLGKIGCALCVIGSTMMVIHSPKEQEVADIDTLKAMVAEPGFIVYATLIIIIAVFLIIHTAPRYGNKNVLVYITICASLGSFTVMGCKGVGVGLKQTMDGHSQLTNWMFYILLGVVITCILIQLNYLNRALDTFNTAVVTPIYYVFFTSLVMVASLILYKEWKTMKIEDILGDLCGFLTIIAGIFLLNAFKDFNVSLNNLPGLSKKPVAGDEEGDGMFADNNNFRVSNDDHEHLLENGQLESLHSADVVRDYHDELPDNHLTHS